MSILNTFVTFTLVINLYDLKIVITRRDDRDSDRDFHFDRRLLESMKLWFDRNALPTFLYEGAKVPDKSVMHVYTP